MSAVRVLGRRGSLALALLVASAVLSGCSGSSGGGASSKSSSEQGKTYSAPTKGGAGGDASGSAPPTSAETVTSKPSAGSDAGQTTATHNQPVMNPGAPPEHAAKKASGAQSGH